MTGMTFRRKIRKFEGNKVWKKARKEGCFSRKLETKKLFRVQ